ncbi:hypothetical protein VTH06DRAFT_3848 [Thermothelomyces fergusii]
MWLCVSPKPTTTSHTPNLRDPHRVSIHAQTFPFVRSHKTRESLFVPFQKHFPGPTTFLRPLTVPDRHGLAWTTATMRPRLDTRRKAAEEKKNRTTGLQALDD